MCPRFFILNKSGLETITMFRAVFVLLGLLFIEPYAQGTPSLKAEFTLVSNSTIMLGEPIVLHYKINNISDVSLIAPVSSDAKDWRSMILVDSHSQSVPPREYAKVVERSPLDTDEAVISAHKSLEGYIVVSRLFQINRPGSYVLLLNVRLPYGYPDGVLPPPPSDPRVFTGNYRIPFRVTQANAAQLRSTAQSLLTDILQPATNDPLRKAMLCDALFSMPEAAAYSSWQAVALDKSNANRLLAVNALARLSTADAADMLADVIYSQPHSSSNMVETEAREKLNAMYNAGDARLRQHIKDIATMHGVQLRDIVHLPAQDN